jgi:methionyl-tRNA formyltransferase
MKIIFFGTSEFGAIILKKLVQAGLLPVLVVTTPDKPAGRKQMLTPPPVKVLAKAQGPEVFQPEKFNQDAIRFIQEKNPDLFVVAAYGKILPKTVLSIPQKGSLNVHPSLLPKYRGPSPVQAALLNGDKETGVSVIVLDEAMDHGPIIASSNFKIQNPKLTYPNLHNELAKIGADLLIKTIPDWIAGKIKPVPQDDSKATYTRILQKEDGRIDWSKEAMYIERQVRALYPWPGTFTTCETDGKQKMIKILKASVLPQERPIGKPGQAFPPPLPGIAIQTGKDALVIEELQLEGAKPMSSKEFLLGHKNFLGTILK